MRILITGSTGLVGHNIAEVLLTRQHQLLLPAHADLDLLAYDAVAAYLERERPDCIIHAAGTVGGIVANVKNPVKFLLTNMDMGRNIIYAAFNAGIMRLINMGSSCMYPCNSTAPLSEEMVLTGKLEPTNEGYALAKIMCTKLCEYICREHPQYEYKTLIPCNLYGKWDKFDLQTAHMIPAAINKIYTAKLNNVPQVCIWGDGSARREFMYAEDLAHCVDFCLDNFKTMPDVMNVGLGNDYTVNEYYETIAEVIGYEGRFSHDLHKPVGMQRKLTDITRQKKFGWQASTSLRDGIKSTYEFYLNNFIKAGR